MASNEAFVRWVLGVGAAVVVGFVLAMGCAGLGCWFGGGAFVRFGIGTDLEDYGRWVRGSDLGDAERSEVLRRLERIEDGVADRSIAVPFFAWITIDEQVEDLIRDGHIPPDELARLHDQLNRIESWRD